MVCRYCSVIRCRRQCSFHGALTMVGFENQNKFFQTLHRKKGFMFLWLERALHVNLRTVEGTLQSPKVTWALRLKTGKSIHGLMHPRQSRTATWTSASESGSRHSEEIVRMVSVTCTPTGGSCLNKLTNGMHSTIRDPIEIPKFYSSLSVDLYS